MMLCFLPQRTPLTGFIRVFTTSLTSQRGEKLQHSHRQTETCGHGRRREGRGGETFYSPPEKQERPDFLLRFYFQGFVTVTPLTFLQCCGSIKAFCLLSLFFFVVVFFTPHFFQSPSAAVTIILCIWEDFLPVSQPDTAISLGQIAPSCKVFITGHSQLVTVPNPLYI